MSAKRKPWERLENESAKAYLAFCNYLELGTKRSIVQLTGGNPSKRRWLERWSAKFQWVERTTASDTQHLESRLSARDSILKKLQVAALEEAPRAFETLVGIARGEVPAFRDQVKAITIILDRVGFVELPPEEGAGTQVIFNFGGPGRGDGRETS